MTFTTTLLKRILMRIFYWYRQFDLWNKIRKCLWKFFKWKDLFDFSNYSKDSKFYDDVNKKVIGKMKDEYDGVIIDQFVGLKSKMYSIKKIKL